MTTRIGRLRERFEADPTDRAAFEALEEHHFLQGEWAALIPLYEQHLAADQSARSPLEGARLLYRMGHALDEAGVDPERAEDCHRRALEMDPRFAPALRRLRASCAAAGRWDEMLALAAREADSAARPTERAALLAETGEACLRAGEPVLAVQAFEQARAADAGSRRAWIGLGEALERSGRIEDAIQCWEQALEFALQDGRDRAVAQRAAGRLLSDVVGDAARALEIYEAAHQAAPEQPEWLDAMVGPLRKLGRSADVIALAERRFAATNERTTRARIALETGRLLLAGATDPIRAQAWLQRAADLQEDGDIHLALAEAAGQRGDGAGRTWHLERAMELGADIPSWSDLGLGGAPAEDPSPAVLERLRHDAEERPADAEAIAALSDALAGGPHDLERAELLERLAALTGDPAGQSEHLMALGELYETQLDDAPAAADAYQRAFDVAPEQPIAFEALGRTLRKLDRVEELDAVFARAAAAAPPPRRAELLAASGDRLLARGRDPRAALDCYLGALDADPSLRLGYEGAAQAAAAAGDEETALAVRLREAEHAPPERLAVLVPELLSALRAQDRIDRALPALRRHAELSQPSDCALAALAHTLEELGHTEELSDVLERLDGCLNGAERGANQRRLAWLHAAEGRTDAAITAWRAALRHDPSDVASLEALLDAFAETDRAEDALALLDALATRDPDAAKGSRAVALHRARALERGGRFREAADAWRALHADGERSEALFAAWERSARNAGDPAALAHALESHAAEAGDPAERERLDAARARILDRELARPEEARAIWERLACSDGDAAEEAAHQLETLLERLGDIPALCDHLAARSERDATANAWRVHARIAELAETRIGDLGRARRHLEMAVALSPSRAVPWRRLAALYDEQGQPAEWLHAVEGEIAALVASGDDAEAKRRIGLHVAAARVAEHQLADSERAASHWERVLALAPGHAEASEWMLASCEADGRHEEAASLLRSRIEKIGRAASDAERVTDLCLRLADLLATRLGRPDEAIAILESAPATGVGARAAAERLAALYADSGRHDALAALCATRAPDATDPATRVQWRIRQADALRAHGDVAGAESAYEAALLEAPEAAGARTALCDLLRARGDAARLATHLEQALRRGGARSPALHRELAALYAGPLARPARALEHWIHLLALDPSDDDARERTLALALELGRLDDAVALLRSVAVDPRTGAARSGCWARCGELLAGPLGRPEEAVRSWQESLRLDPDQPTLRRRLRLQLESLGRIEDALAELHAEWRAAPAPARAELAAHGADLAAATSFAALAPWLARLVADVPDDPELWTAIAALHARSGRRAEGERALAEAARCAPDRGWRCALHRERAAWLENALDAPGRACAALEAALREDPGHPGVLASLDRLYTALDRPRERLEVLSARLEATRRPAMRVALAASAASLAAALGDSERAADLWLTALEAAPEAERPALLAPAVDAQRAARRTHQWAGLAEQELAEGAPSPARVLALRRALARPPSGLGSDEGALVHARALVDAGAAARDDDHRLLLALLRVQGDALERARRLADWAVRAPDGSERQAAWRELAQLREERLADSAGAADAWRELLRIDPGAADAWTGLRRCAERCSDTRELARALEAELELGVTPAGPRWRRLGLLRWRELGDADGAARALQAARDAEPDELSALRALQEIAESTGAYERAAALSAEELELLGDADPGRRQALWLSIARISSRQAPDPQRAAHAFEQAHPLGDLTAPDLASWSAALAAIGAADRWREIFAAWCDHSDARPDGRDLLALAKALRDDGLADAAEARLTRALALDPALGEAWRLSAQLREAAGDTGGAAEAWRRAAENESGSAAAESWARAAAHLEATAPERALTALEHASACAPGFAPAEAALARLAELRGRCELALAAAIRLFAQDGDPTIVEIPQRLAAALAGARSARTLARWPSAWQLGGEALALDAQSPDALAARGLAVFHLGATGECCRDLAARLAQPVLDERRSELSVALARALENSGELEAALERHGDALADEPDLDDAHAGRLRVLERLGRRAEAAAALAAWAAQTEPPERRAERYVRAARLARHAATDAAPSLVSSPTTTSTPLPSRSAWEPVEGWLREAIAAEPTHPTAWYELATGLWDEGRTDEAFAAASEGTACVRSPGVRAVLETLRGRSLEARGEDLAAMKAYQAAVECDPEAREAALAGARLLRRAGCWHEAAGLLLRAADGHGDAAERAALFFERGRLLAGPLEDVAGALESYDRARALAPERLDIREARAALLGQLPGRADEALAELAAVLEGSPLRIDAIRRATRIADARGDATSSRRGRALLRALGVASPLERREAPTRIDLACEAAMPALDRAGEALRKLVVCLSSGAAASAASGTTRDAESEDRTVLPSPARPNSESAPDETGPCPPWTDAATELIGTPRLLTLAPAALRSALEDLLAQARAGAGGRAAKRALRRVDEAALELVALSSWRTALRARTWARMVDAVDGNLRTVLAVMAEEAGAPAIGDEGDLTPWLADSPEASALLKRVMRAWLAGPA